MKSLIYIIGISFVYLNLGCKKFLDVKPDKKLAIPGSLKSLRAMLDNTFTLNYISSGIGEASADNYYLDLKDFNAQTSSLRNTYTWEAEIGSENVWDVLYKKVYVANVAMEELEKLPADTSVNERNELKGTALFIRANTFLILATTFAKQYDKTNASNTPGVPLRLSSNFNDKSSRSSLEETYLQTEKDLLEAKDLLPNFAIHPMRPSKWAAYALLSRMYLSMNNHELAYKYADLCLLLRKELMDYNQLNSSTSYPIPRENTESIYYTYGSSRLPTITVCKIPLDFYTQYEEFDLRKKLFFQANTDGSQRFRGGYTGSSTLFTGIAIDEVYLTSAECLARKGDFQKSMEVLNSLLIKRYATGKFIEKQASDAKGALKLVLAERRKELLFRDLRWMDLKRLNTEPDQQTTLIRTINGQEYKLLPNENRYAIPLPTSVIQLTGMEQNPR